MTPAEAQALGRRWREAKGDMERPGMRWIDTTGTLSPVRVVIVEEGVRITTTAHKLYRPSRDALDVPTWPDWVPDLRDGATKGAALEVVRERWGIKRLWVEFQVDNAMWSVGDWALGWACLDGETPPPDITADSEEELLVAALEVAPPVKL